MKGLAIYTIIIMSLFTLVGLFSEVSLLTKIIVIGFYAPILIFAIKYLAKI
jgi:hypothetical protein